MAMLFKANESKNYKKIIFCIVSVSDLESRKYLSAVLLLLLLMMLSPARCSELLFLLLLFLYHDTKAEDYSGGGEDDCVNGNLTGFRVIGSNLITNAEPIVDEEGRTLMKINWVSIVEPPEAVVCIKTFTLFYGRRNMTKNKEYERLNCVPVPKSDKSDLFQCFRSVSRTPSEDRNIDPIVVDICGDDEREVFMKVRLIDQIVGDNEDEQGQRIPQISVKLDNLPSCSHHDEEQPSDSISTTIYIYIAVFIGGAIAASVLLFSIFCLRRYFMKKKEKKQAE